MGTAKASCFGLLSSLVLAACMVGGPEASDVDLTESAAEPQCTDRPPGDSATCGQQVGWGKCNEPWMAGLCDRSCGRCPGIGTPKEACIDEPLPNDPYSCAQQAAWGKCDEPWMEGHCQLSCNRCPVSAQLIDPKASKNTREVMSYLVSTYREQVLSGQHGLEEAEYMAALTGKRPAILGLDLMDYSPSRVEHGATSDATEQAMDWWQHRGGIVTLCWHWNAPANLKDPWWEGFYDDGTTFDLGRAMSDPSSTEYQLILRDIDAIAVQLQRLEDAGVPVLWRPIHEASGGVLGAWFWWGDWGPGPYLSLWRLLYDRLVNHHGLHNLIWVWNGQDPSFYPGDQYVDVVSEDIYDKWTYNNPQEKAYLEATRYSKMPKLVALSETGALPDPKRLLDSQARWSWFMLWSGDYATGQSWNDDKMKQSVYTSGFITTLDELPHLAVE